MHSKVLVVVYSYTGTSLGVAKLICAQHDWPRAAIEETRPRSGAWGYWRCLLDSFLRRHPPIRYSGPPPEDFDAVVLVSPIWALRLAGPMRTFLAQHHLRLPDVAVVSVMGGRGALNAETEIGDVLGRAPIMATAVLEHEVRDGRCVTQLQAFGAAVRSAEHPNEASRPPLQSPGSI